jgi:hypothetical protein
MFTSPFLASLDATKTNGQMEAGTTYLMPVLNVQCSEENGDLRT